MKHFNIIIFLFFLLFIISISACMVKKTENAALAYKYWSGSKPPKEIEIVHAKYWESSHWSKEYIMYLDLKASTHWIHQFIEQNKLIESEKVKIISDDIPGWFRPPVGGKIFVSADSTNDSVYYYDSLAHKLLVYEIQL